MNIPTCIAAMLLIWGLALIASRIDWKKETADLFNLFRKGDKNA